MTRNTNKYNGYDKPTRTHKYTVSLINDNNLITRRAVVVRGRGGEEEQPNRVGPS